jgi:hypothetical protein
MTGGSIPEHLHIHCPDRRTVQHQVLHAYAIVLSHVRLLPPWCARPDDTQRKHDSLQVGPEDELNKRTSSTKQRGCTREHQDSVCKPSRRPLARGQPQLLSWRGFYFFFEVELKHTPCCFAWLDCGTRGVSVLPSAADPVCWTD